MFPAFIQHINVVDQALKHILLDLAKDMYDAHFPYRYASYRAPKELLFHLAQVTLRGHIQNRQRVRRSEILLFHDLSQVMF